MCYLEKKVVFFRFHLNIWIEEIDYCKQFLFVWHDIFDTFTKNKSLIEVALSTPNDRLTI